LLFITNILHFYLPLKYYKKYVVNEMTSTIFQRSGNVTYVVTPKTASHVATEMLTVHCYKTVLDHILIA